MQMMYLRLFMKSLEEILRKFILKLLKVFIKSKTLKDIDINSIKRILIVRQHNEIGDMLLATPLFSAIRKKFPDSFISLIARPRNIDVVINNPDLNEVILYDVRKFRYAPWKLFKFLYDLRKKKFDITIVPCTVSFSLTSALIAYLSKVKYRIGTDGKFFGFYEDSSFFFNIYVPLEKDKHQVDINLDFIKIFKINGIDKRNKLVLLSHEEEQAKILLEKITKNNKKILIAVHPGAGKEKNRWSAFKFGKLIDVILNKYNLNVLLMWGKGEEQIVKEVLENTSTSPIVLPLINLRLLAAVLKQCKLFICNDTGVLHIAAGVKTPTIAIFGPSNPDFWNPVGEEHKAIRGKDGTTDSVSVDEVEKGVRSLLFTLQQESIIKIE